MFLAQSSLGVSILSIVYTCSACSSFVLIIHSHVLICIDFCFFPGTTDVLAVMGPSGAGKTVLLDALTLDAFFGKPSGKVTLNGVPITDKIFKEHCYVVVQEDKHWPYLTCRETLRYAAELYDVVVKEDLEAVVDEIIAKMGLTVCGDTRNARLSGGQMRRLSLGIALLKQPTMLFLDEPTTGLDSAAAENIMQEIVRVAKEEKLIVLCSIHQPSTKVYNGFDQVVRYVH
jgi:ABC-type multidrug transport system ATPase subunit